MGTLTLGLAHISVIPVPSTALKEGTGGKRMRTSPEPREESETQDCNMCSHCSSVQACLLLMVIIPPRVFSDPFMSQARFKVISMDHFH